MKRYGSIYIIRRKSDGFSYVGKTTRPSVMDRFNDHYWKTSSKMYIDLAMRKEGRNAFEIEELYVAFSEEALNEAEKVLVAQMGTLWPNGFNLKDGGKGNTRHTEEARRRIAEAKAKNPGTGNTGHSQKDTARAVISKKLGGQIIVGINVEDPKKVIFFASAHEAGRYGFQPWNVITICKGRSTRRICKGYTFMYYSNYVNQNGSLGSNEPRHVQRIGLETANAE